MVRPKRKSAILETSLRRLAGMKQITPKLDFGPGLTEEAYEAEINGYSSDLLSYNGDIAALDDKTNLLADRQQLADLNLRILAAGKARFGPDSREFELLGGVRRSDRKKAGRPPKPKAT